MRLIIEPNGMIFTGNIPRGTSPSEILSATVISNPRPDISKHLPSSRSYYDAQFLCAPIELTSGKRVLLSEIMCMAVNAGWDVADVRETAAFIYHVVPGYPNQLPEYLVSGFTTIAQKKRILILKRDGHDRESVFTLREDGTMAIKRASSQPEVLLVREYRNEE